MYAIWYPIQDQATADDFRRRCKRLGLPKMLAVEFCVMPEQAFELTGSGMILINPPWKLDEQLRALLPWLTSRLAAGGQGRWSVDWLTGETLAA